VCEKLNIKYKNNMAETTADKYKLHHRYEDLIEIYDQEYEMKPYTRGFLFFFTTTYEKTLTKWKTRKTGLCLCGNTLDNDLHYKGTYIADPRSAEDKFIRQGLK
jgi:hypothetical protein